MSKSMNALKGSKTYTVTPHGIPLPAMPGDGTTQCLVNCHCQWEIIPLDADNGDFDAYWKMADAEHCQTCQVRAVDWNPLRIRNWTYRLPSQQVLTEQLAEEVGDICVGAGANERLKHLPSEHRGMRHPRNRNRSKED